MPPLAAEINGVSQSHRERRILIVEDNQDGADVLSMLLELQGHDTRVAYNGPDGIKLAREYRPDVILCDIQLPCFDGCEFARRIRDEFGDSIIMAAMTGWGSDGDRERTREAGFNYHFVKPIKTEQLELVFSDRCTIKNDCDLV